MIVGVVKDVKSKPPFVELRYGNLDLYFQPNHNVSGAVGRCRFLSPKKLT